MLHGYSALKLIIRYTNTHKKQAQYSHLLHHAATVSDQAAVRIVDVRHVLGAPQALSHSTGPRPALKTNN